MIMPGLWGSADAISNFPAPLPKEPPVLMVSILNEKDPLSLVNLLPPKLKEHVISASKQCPDLFAMEEERFLAYHKAEKIFFNATEVALRTQFWIEYHQVRVAKKGTVMRVSNIIAGVCSKEMFYRHYLRSVHRVAWLCVMPLHYHRILENHLTRLAHDMSDIIDRPLTDPETNKWDHKLAKMKIDLFKMIEATVHGSPTQRIDQRTLALNVTRHEVQRIADHKESRSDESMLLKIRQLEAQERSAAHVPKLAEWQTMPVTNPSVQSPPPPNDEDPKGG